MLAERQHEARMLAVDQWVEESKGEETAIMPGPQVVPMLVAKEKVAEGSREEKTVVVPRYVLVAKGDREEEAVVLPKGDRVAMVWMEEEVAEMVEAKEEAVLVVTESSDDSEDDPIVEEEKVVRPGAKFVKNPFFKK